MSGFHKKLTSSFLVATIVLLSAATAFAAPRSAPFVVGETVDPGADAEPCGPLDTNCFPSLDSSINSYVHASTTIPKLYGANIFSALQTFINGLVTNTLSVGSLTGPLQAVNGTVSATSTLSTIFGGTGTSTAPSYGQLLLGNALGGYSLTATSSLGITPTLSGNGIVTNYGSIQSTLSTSSLPVNVRDYGATGDGSTDDTASIQAAINVATSTKRRLYIPGGIYKITSDLTLSTGSTGSGLMVYGDGSYATLHNSAPTNIYVVNSNTGSNGFKILGNSNHLRISDLNFSGSNAATSTGYAMYIDGTANGGGSVDDMIIENVSVNRMNGIFASAVSNSTFIQFGINGGQGGCAIGAFFATGINNSEANNANYWNGPITGCTVGWHLQSGIGFHIQSSDTGAATMETALLMDGMNNVSVANSNWEMYSVGSTTIENLSASKTLSIRDSQIRAFGPQNGKYSIIKGANALVLENTNLEYLGAHGGAIKETTTINATVVSSGAYTTKVESFNSLGGTWYGNYVAGLFRTDSQSSGLGASASTIGTMWQRVGSSTISTLNFGAQRSDNATYEWVDMLKYWKDTTVNNLTVIGNVSPTYGMIPVGNASAGYTLMSTSSLNISGGGTIGSGTQGQFPFYDAAGNTLTATSSLFVSQTGNIGIGMTALPTNKLQIQGPSSGTGASIAMTNGVYAGGASALFIGLPLSGNQFQTGASAGDTVFTAKGGGSLKFGTNVSGSSGTTRLIIDTLGRTCVGDTSYCTYNAMFQVASSTATTLLKLDGATADVFNVKGDGKVGIGTTTPWRNLSVTGTMAINGLTGSTGGGSLCLSASNEVVYNSGSDACLPSLRDTKHDIQDLSVDALSLVSSLNPSSFVYNSGDQRVRYGFIAEEAQTIDPHLVTYSAAGELSGIDDRAVTSLLVKALQEQQILIDTISSIASSTASAVDATDRETFLGRFYGQVRSWLANSANTIGDFFAGRVHTKVLCIGDDEEGETCISKDQLDELLSANDVDSIEPEPIHEDEQATTENVLSTSTENITAIVATTTTTSIPSTLPEVRDGSITVPILDEGVDAEVPEEEATVAEDLSQETNTENVSETTESVSETVTEDIAE